MPDIDKNYYLDREGIDTLATEVKSKIADAAKTVKQSATATNADYEVLFSQTADNTTHIEEAGKNSNLKFNPSTGNLQATQLNGVTIGSSPKFTDTTYTFDTGDNNGQIKVTPSGGSAQNISVKGLGSAAYKSFTNEYVSTGTNVVTGTAINAALQTLDGTVSGTPSASKTLTAFSETDGKVSATFADISITKSQISDFPSNNITGSGTSGYLTKFNGANTVTNGPALGLDTTKYLRNDGSWQVPQDPKKFTITGSQPTSYRRGVIALCRVSTSANTQLDSFSSGTITFHRSNGLAGVCVIKYAIENQYSTAYAANVSNLGSNFPEVASPTLPKGRGWSWCSFKHNDIYYAGIEFYIADAELQYVIDDYVGNFEPFGFTWYDTQNSTILDTEFSNSVSYTTPAHLSDEFTVKKAESATDNTKVAKAGDTMSGTLTFTTTNGIAYTGTQATYNMIKFKDNTDDTYGNGLILGGGGLTVVGGGESADAVANTYTSGGSENLDLASDGAVTVWTNVQAGATSADVRKFVFDATGSLTIPTTVKVNSLASGTDGGLSIYGGSTPTNYGITMRQTGSSTGQLGKHGYVQGDWACYLNFHGNNTATRGWVFRDAALGNIASISTQTGNLVLNGSVTIGGNTTNTSGARMEYNSTTQSIDFVFV